MTQGPRGAAPDQWENKMLSKAAGIFMVASGLLLAGCATQPIQNVQAPVATTKPKPSMDEVRQAIVRAGSGLGWQIKPEKPGHLVGTLALRTHVAVVDINHTQTDYSIKYRDSTNLDYKDGQIHRNYNGWIQNLDKAIKIQLQNL
jgi:hypothetical protein